MTIGNLTTFINHYVSSTMLSSLYTLIYLILIWIYSVDCYCLHFMVEKKGLIVPRPQAVRVQWAHLLLCGHGCRALFPRALADYLSLFPNDASSFLRKEERSVRLAIPYSTSKGRVFWLPCEGKDRREIASFSWILSPVSLSLLLQ